MNVLSLPLLRGSIIKFNSVMSMMALYNFNQYFEKFQQDLLVLNASIALNSAMSASLTIPPLPDNSSILRYIIPPVSPFNTDADNKFRNKIANSYYRMLLSVHKSIKPSRQINYYVNKILTHLPVLFWAAHIRIEVSFKFNESY